MIHLKHIDALFLEFFINIFGPQLKTSEMKQQLRGTTVA